MAYAAAAPAFQIPSHAPVGIPLLPRPVFRRFHCGAGGHSGISGTGRGGPDRGIDHAVILPALAENDQLAQGVVGDHHHESRDNLDDGVIEMQPVHKYLEAARFQHTREHPRRRELPGLAEHNLRAPVKRAEDKHLVDHESKDDGYDPGDNIADEIIDMDKRSVADIIQRGGTVLYTARCMEFMTEEGQKRGAEVCRKHGIDGIVVIGGDGSFRGAQKLAAQGINTIGLPGTIDLDIACTDYTIGFDTAVNTAMEAIDKIRDTSTSHERCSIIEVMGRNAGYIALWCGIANGAEDILLPERYDNDEQTLINHIIEGRKKGKKHHLIINAEGIGHSTGMARRIEAATGIETRATILGYMQRGGSPTCKDRMYASIMGAYAVDLLAEGKSNRLVAYKDGKFVDYDIDEALAMTKDINDYEFNISALLSK